MLFEEIAKANIQALKDHDKTARSILSILYGKLKLASIDKGLGAKTLPDGDVVNIIAKTIKELDEEALGYEKANRMENVSEIKAQKAIIQKYMPAFMTEAEIKTEIAKLEDKSIPSVMKYFKSNFNGKCDMGLVSKIAKEFQ